MSINHRTEAEKHLSQASYVNGPQQHPVDPIATDFHLRMAAVHAQLAAGETAAADAASTRHALATYRSVLIQHIGGGLAHSKGDEAHEHALGLAKHLDSIGLNVDREVDTYIDQYGEITARDAWLSPTDRRAKWDAEHPCPF
ncbi:hypothetical protein ACFTWD_09315 [Streptomyces sp. NPDC056943]|uniref:hypothetical protein n=1 Tax=Streptomyces sp. NPDC056943 TaxID=3345971 RepID=UPI0036390D5B